MFWGSRVLLCCAVRVLKANEQEIDGITYMPIYGVLR